jgi:hypothetical protein
MSCGISPAINEPAFREHIIGELRQVTIRDRPHLLAAVEESPAGLAFELAAIPPGQGTDPKIGPARMPPFCQESTLSSAGTGIFCAPIWND